MANRILFISDEHPRPGYGGGERVLSIYNALNKLGEVHVLFVASPHTPSDISPPPLPRRTSHTGHHPGTSQRPGTGGSGSICSRDLGWTAGLPT